MPWNDQSGGGGPWGSGGGGGGQSPWGNQPRGPQRGGGQNPPDLEELVRNIQGRMGGLFGGRRRGGSGGGGGFGFLLILALGLIGWAAWPGAWWFIVQQEEIGVVMRFGEVNRQREPGFHLKLPSPIEIVYRPPVRRVNTVDIGYVPDARGEPSRDIPDESLMLTGDENIADIDLTVQWRIRDPAAYLFNLRDPDEVVKLVAESALREVVGQSELGTLISERRDDIAQRVRIRMQQILDEYEAGVFVREVNLRRAEPPASVIEAFNDVTAADTDAESYVNQANRHANQVVPLARGEAARIREDAEAYAARVVAEAAGEADRFSAIYEQYRLAPEVTRRRLYLETMEDVIGRANTIIMDGESGSGVVPYLPLNELPRSRVQGGDAAGGGQ